MPSKINSNVKSTKNLDKIIGNKVNLLRLNKGLTRQELAKTIGVTHQQLQKYVTGKNRITASRLVDIAKALEAPVTYFFEDPNNQKRLQELMLEQESITIMKHYSRLSSKTHRDFILDLIKIFIENEQQQAL